MRRSSRKAGLTVRTMVEQLEGRMLLSVWEGTWTVKGLEFDAEPAQPNGEASFRAMTISAVITDVAPGQYQFRVPAYGYTVMLSGDDTEIGQTGSDASVDSYMRLRMVDPGVILAVHAEAGYETDGVADRQSVSWANFFSGIGTQKAAPTVQFAWEGQYAVHDAGMEIGWNGQGYGSQWRSDTMDVTAELTASGQYSIGQTGSTDQTLYSPSGSKLLYRQAGPDNDGYQYKCEQIWRGPYARLYHFGGSVSFDPNTGQLQDASFDAAYTDPHGNVAPVLDRAGSPMFDAINEDKTDSAGTSVADLLAASGSSTYIYDANSADARGIAVVGTDTKRGTWQYSLDGSTWQEVGKVTGSSALLLDGTARLRFVPKTNYFGTLSKAITFRAWDQTAGANGGRASVNASGKTTAFSKATDVASLVVNPMNDAPVISGNSVALTYTAGGTPVSIFSGMKITDVDSKLLTSVTVEFSGGYTPGADVITYRGPSSVTVTRDETGGTLTLTLSSTSGAPLSIGTFTSALKAITFSTPAQHAPVTITFSVTDKGILETADQTTSVDRILQIA